MTKAVSRTVVEKGRLTRCSGHLTMASLSHVGPVKVEQNSLKLSLSVKPNASAQAFFKKKEERGGSSSNRHKPFIIILGPNTLRSPMIHGPILKRRKTNTAAG